MKKVKIMLMSIAVLAVVGGALAFKAKAFNQFYCYENLNHFVPANAVGGVGACPLVIQSSKDEEPSRFIFATINPDPNGNPAACTTITCPATSLVGE